MFYNVSPYLGLPNVTKYFTVSAIVQFKKKIPASYSFEINIIKFSIGLMCFITLLGSLILARYGITLPFNIIMGMFAFIVLSFVVYIIWVVTGYDD